MSEETTYPNKRPPRPLGRDLPIPSTGELALICVNSDALETLVAPLPHLPPPGAKSEPNAGGRPTHFPHAAMATWGMIGSNFGSKRFGAREMRGFWEPVRAELARRYPQYRGLDSGSPPPTRRQFHGWQEKIVQHHLAEFNRAFTLGAVELSQRMGMYDPTRRDINKIERADMLVGDGTVFTARMNAAPGDLQLNTLTSELEQKPYDPDAGRQVQKRDDETERLATAGTLFGIIHGTTGFTHEGVMLAGYHVPKGPGNSEAWISMEVLAWLIELLPGVKALAWDKAMRGVHIDAGFDLGIQIIAKVSQQGKKPREALIELMSFRAGDEIVGQLPLYAVGGAGHVSVPTPRGNELIPLIPLAVHRRDNLGERGRPYRWYRSFKVPTDARIPARFHGTTCMARLDTTAEDRARDFNRAEVFRCVAETDPDWSDRYHVRPRAETMNSWLKYRWPNKRALSIGAGRQHLDLLLSGLRGNLIAGNAYEKRSRTAVLQVATRRAA
jgi:hypothetical protein